LPTSWKRLTLTGPFKYTFHMPGFLSCDNE
jgi:hypothetical protein